MARRIFVGLLVASSLVTAAPAAAQSAEGEPGQAPGWTFIPAVTIGWLRDSNVAMVPDVFGEDIRADNLLVLTPSGTVNFLGKHTNFGAGYTGTIRRYRELDALNSYDQRLRLTLAHRPSARLLLSGSDSVARLATTDETELNGVPFQRIGSRVNNANVGFEYRMTKFSTLRAAYELIDAAFDRQPDLPGYVLGGRSNGLTSEYSQRITERVALGAIYEVRFAQIKTAAGPDQPLRFQEMGPALRYGLGPSTMLLLAGGLSTLSDPALGTSTGPFIRAGITHRLQRATIDGGYERSFVPTFGFAARSQTEQLHGSVQMPVYRNRMYVQASSSWRRNNPLLANELALKSFVLSAVTGYAFARPVHLEGYYTTAWQDTRVAGGQVNRHRLGVQLVLSTPLRAR